MGVDVVGWIVWKGSNEMIFGLIDVIKLCFNIFFLKENYLGKWINVIIVYIFFFVFKWKLEMNKINM